MKGGVPPRKQARSDSIILKITQLPQITSSHEREQTCEASDDEDTVMLIDDTTLSKVIDTSQHSSGSSTGNTERNVNKVRRFANDEEMDANRGKM